MAKYIERDAAIHTAEKYGLRNGSALGRHSGVADRVSAELEGLPAADVAPVVHGRWVWNEECYTWDCTNCNGFVGSGSRISAYVHCPLCGARMDGGADNG